MADSAERGLPGVFGNKKEEKENQAQQPGFVEKIKEKIPGQQHGEAQCSPGSEGPPKKGFMEKIKENIPGQQHGDAQCSPGSEGPPKKGFVEKVKEKIPGQQGQPKGN